MALKQDRFHPLGEWKYLYLKGFVNDTTNRPAVDVKGDAFELKMTKYNEEVDIVILSMVK